MSESPSPNSTPRNAGVPANRPGAQHAETVRITAPDLLHRAAMEKTRARLVFSAIGFALLFAAVALKLADATVVQPLAPHRPERPIARLLEPQKAADATVRSHRAMIIDRNGEFLAVSLPTVALYANPKEMIDTAEAAHRLKQALPRLDEARVEERLANAEKQFVYLARQLSPHEQVTINALGIPGVYFESTERRRYPLGRTAAHLLGGVDVDGNGIAGVEKQFDQRLREDNSPLRLSVDVKVQAVVRDELSKAIADFNAIGGCGLVMDVNTGEVIAMVSLPDYDANLVRQATDEERFNRAVTGMYEPGSTFKLQTAAMALDNDVVHLWDQFDAAHPIHIGRFTITDFEGKKRFLYLPEVLVYSSNLGAAHIAQAVGAERQRNWLRSMGMLDRIGVELPEAGRPLAPPASNWKEIATMTIGFGHGIAVSPLHVVRGTAAIANGGIVLRPTILARTDAETLVGEAHGPEGTRVMQVGTSDTMRKIMRLVVTDGYGKPADVPGYYPGGKTGTAEKVAAHGGYKKHTNVAAFMSVFPMQHPRYAVYIMLDEPKANASTHGYATAGWVAAPAAGRVIGRIAPMLGMLPEIDNMVQINQSLAMPLQPTRPAHGVPMAGKSPAPAVPLRQIPTSVPPPVLRDPHHEAQAPASDPAPHFPQGPIGASVVPANIGRIAAPRAALQNAAR